MEIGIKKRNRFLTQAFRAFAITLIILCAGCKGRADSAAPKAPAPGPVATITLVEGVGAAIRLPGKTAWTPAQEDADLPAGAAVRTGASSRLELQFADNSIIRLNSLTQMTLNMPDPKTRQLQADSGQIWVHLKKINSDSKFEVKTPQMIAGVRGTTFWVDVDAEEGDSVSVDDGEVEVQRGERRVMLRKRMRARMAKGMLGNPEQFDPEKRARWEKWTERHVKARFEKMREEVAAYRKEARKVAADAKDVLTQARDFIKAARASGGEIQAEIRNAKTLIDRAATIEDRVRSALDKTGRGRGVNKERLMNIKQAIQQTLGDIDRESGPIDASARKADGLAQSSADLLANVKKLQEEFDALRDKQAAFSALMEKNRRRRSFDPQWRELSPISEGISQDETQISGSAAEAEGALSGKSFQAEEKADRLSAILENAHTRIIAKRNDASAAQSGLSRARTSLSSLLADVESAINNQ